MRHVTRAGLAVADVLADFVETEALPGTGVEAGAFWDAFAAIVRDLAPRNRELLSIRDRMQARIDEWHRANGAPSDMAAYRGFLQGDRLPRRRGARLPRRDLGRRRRDRPDLRPAARRAGNERALRAQRGERPLGIALRRALRHRRHRRGRRPGARRALQPGARGGRRRLDAGVPRRGRAPPRCRLGGRARVQGGGRHAGRGARRRRDGARAAGAARGLPRRRGGAEGDPPPQQRARDPGPHRPGHAESGGTTRRTSPTSGWRRR